MVVADGDMGRWEIGGRDSIDVGITSNTRQFCVIVPGAVSVAKAMLLSDGADDFREDNGREDGNEEEAEEDREEDFREGRNHFGDARELFVSQKVWWSLR